MPNDEWGDFQTPPELVSEVFGVLGDRGWGRILEPTCGRGAFLAGATTSSNNAELLGIEVQDHYVEEARQRGFTVLHRSIFEVELAEELPWTSDGRLLVVGNPPWVTSSKLGELGSINLPEKRNIRNLSGFDAMTGSSNFDIAEYILLKLMLELDGESPTIALLVKTHVARNVLSYAAQFSLPYSNFAIRRIDAKASFGASVDACLFSLEHSNKPTYECDVYDTIAEVEPTRRIGVVNGQMVADIERYKNASFADGVSPVEWRSGVKHDAARVMEISGDRRVELGLEDRYVFPLLKCSDIFRGRHSPTKYMVVPQHSFGEDTSHLQEDAPRLWEYLQSNADVLDQRGSSIYLRQPRFTVFGLGAYTFAQFRIAISGLHKEVRFALLGSHEGKPIVVDDASYVLGFDDGHEAALCLALLEHQHTSDLLESLVFWDAKRPISKKLLQRLDLAAVAARAGVDDLAADASRHAEALGLKNGQDWSTVLASLAASWQGAGSVPEAGTLPGLG